MNIRIDTEDLMSLYFTEEHKKGLQDKITKAIESIDEREISDNIRDLVVSNIEDTIYDLIDFDKVGEEATSVILKTLKKSL